MFEITDEHQSASIGTSGTNVEGHNLSSILLLQYPKGDDGVNRPHIANFLKAAFPA